MVLSRGSDKDDNSYRTHAHASLSLSLSHTHTQWSALIPAFSFQTDIEYAINPPLVALGQTPGEIAVLVEMPFLALTLNCQLGLGALFFFSFMSCQIGGQGTGRRPAPALPQRATKTGSDRPHGQGRYGGCPGILMVGHSEN